MSPESPLLSITIPSWNRARFLQRTLQQLCAELRDRDDVEVLVSDNCSPDDTPAVVAAAQADGLPVRYVRNASNIGSDANIAQCFNMARGDYVLLLGDDDLPVDGALAALLAHLETRRYGVVCLRAYGFEADFRKECPQTSAREHRFERGGAFLAAIGQRMTLISSCVVGKCFIPHLNANQFCGGNLVQVHLVLQAALAAGHNLFLDQYLIACQRNNSGGYNFAQVFVTRFGEALDNYRCADFGDEDIRTIERRMMIGYYPFYLFRQRLGREGDPEASHATFAARFRSRWLFRFWLAPILLLPRPLALAWGGFATFTGRLLIGDLQRGVAFAWHRLMQRLAPRSA
ncbi:glycosyltransferase family 2 protein [Uliginosibacterium sediminicola]|uniref:Glycosyltransferase family 2 protein n=1 Tax=Uliginosibacterium sediminicola TaxID=2024550 RepID=A0ABU9YXC2_9RHOO